MARHTPRSKGDAAFAFLNEPVRVNPMVRDLLAVVVVLGGAAFVLGGVLLSFVTPPRPYPHPTGVVLLAVLMLAMGCGFLFVGVRLLRARTSSSKFLGPRALTICGLMFGVSAGGMGIAAWQVDSVEGAAQAAGAAFMSFLIFRSALSDEHE